MSHEVEREAFTRYLEQHRLKHTKQRDLIVGIFLAAKGHITSDELYQTVRNQHTNIGYTTVYRTLKLLCDAGLAQEHHFDDGVTRVDSRCTLSGAERHSTPSVSVDEERLGLFHNQIDGSPAMSIDHS